MHQLTRFFGRLCLCSNLRAAIGEIPSIATPDSLELTPHQQWMALAEWFLWVSSTIEQFTSMDIRVTRMTSPPTPSLRFYWSGQGGNLVCSWWTGAASSLGILQTDHTLPYRLCQAQKHILARFPFCSVNPGTLSAPLLSIPDPELVITVYKLTFLPQSIDPCLLL